MLEPQGEMRADMRMARICQVLAATHGGKVVEEDFLFKFQGEEQVQSPEEMKRVLLAAVGKKGK